MAIVRKLQIPENPEAGFGAMTIDGSVFFNKPLLNEINLSRTQIEEEKERVLEELKGVLIMQKTVVIDTDECIGCESCTELCPEIFGFGEEEEKAFVILSEGGDDECIDEAISTCPVDCIDWEYY